MIIFKKAEHLYVHTELQLFIFSLCVLKETSFIVSYIVSKKVRLSSTEGKELANNHSHVSRFKY